MEEYYWFNGTQLLFSICGFTEDIWVDENDYLHNEPELPSLIWYNGNEKELKCREQYTKNGKLHNLNDKAWVEYDHGVTILWCSYYIEGKEYSKEEWEIERNRVKMIEEL